jgi:hypothetical protein
MKPYYARIGAVCREQGVHWWLHSCGNLDKKRSESCLVHTFPDRSHPRVDITTLTSFDCGMSEKKMGRLSGLWIAVTL